MPQYDLVGIGNALVDVVAQTDDAFIAASGFAKGSMTLVDAAAADALYRRMPAGIEASGGSCANTMAGFASLGGRGAYIGKVSDDQFGGVFRHDMRAIGCDFDTPAADGGPPTGRCLVLVTPDAQRTMCTHLGAACTLAPGDLDRAVLRNAKVVYMEGYLFDQPAAQQAFAEAAEIVHDAGGEVSVTLSDGFCVDRHRAAFRHLVEEHIDILFANEVEIRSLYQADGFDDALRQVRGQCRVACLTRSEKGAVVVSGEEMHIVEAEPVGAVIDTTGAGDQFAAGFLYGYTRNMSLDRCARIGAVAAAEVIQHYGARPAADLRALVKQKLGA
ncbi:MAG: adenosine kinase [Alphaproteobacteria bacterium]|nr:adenosine kinase [Alphaproteobacteria bacterium]